MLFQQSLNCSHICWALVGCFSFTLWSNSSQTILIRLRSGACRGQVIWCSTPSLSFFLKYSSPYKAWRFVGSLYCWKTNDSPTKLKLAGMVYCCRMLWKPCCLSVPWILKKSQTVSPAKHPQIITPLPPCFTVGTTHAEIIHSPTLRLTKTGRLE